MVMVEVQSNQKRLKVVAVVEQKLFKKILQSQ